MSGRLIVFEGVEGCGKTTQLLRTQEWLQCISSSKSSVSLFVTREPGGTELGLCLRKLLLAASKDRPDPQMLVPPSIGSTKEKQPQQWLSLTPEPLAELLLYAADRAQHVEQVLKPQLALGTNILCDRYTDSTIAYQGYGRGLSLSLINQLNSIATGGLESDLTLWLDVDVEIGLARTKNRGVADRIEQADLAFHRRVQQGYTELALAYPKRIVRVDASLSEAGVQQQIQAILSQQLKLE